jgi:hypothetical protein
MIQAEIRMKVFILWHVSRMPNGEEDIKLIGVYSTEAKAEKARVRSSRLSGFSDAPDGFEVGSYTVDRDSWTEGFVSV